MSSEGGEKAPAAPEVDIYRDTPLRYAGYANEVGEAFRALVSAQWASRWTKLLGNQIPQTRSAVRADDWLARARP